MVEKNYNLLYLGSFWGLLNASVTHIGFKRCTHKEPILLELGGQLKLSLIDQKTISFGQKRPHPQKKIFSIYIFFLIR